MLLVFVLVGTSSDRSMCGLYVSRSSSFICFFSLLLALRRNTATHWQLAVLKVYIMQRYKISTGSLSRRGHRWRIHQGLSMISGNLWKRPRGLLKFDQRPEFPSAALRLVEIRSFFFEIRAEDHVDRKSRRVGKPKMRNPGAVRVKGFRINAVSYLGFLPKRRNKRGLSNRQGKAAREMRSQSRIDEKNASKRKIWESRHEILVAHMMYSQNKTYFQKRTNIRVVKRRGAVEARRAHNPDVLGSKPSGANIFCKLKASHINHSPLCTVLDIATCIQLALI